MVAFGERYRHQRTSAVLDARGSNRALVRNKLAIPAEPHPAAVAHPIEKAYRQAAGRLPRLGIGDAIGNNYEPRHVTNSHERVRRMAQLTIPTRE